MNTNINDIIENYVSENHSVIEKRQIVRDLIKSKVVEDYTATDTASMNGSTCDDIILEVKKEFAKIPNSIHEEKEENKNNSLEDALNVIRNLAMNGNQNSFEIDEEKIKDIVCEELSDIQKDVLEIKDALKNNPNIKNRIPVIQASASGNDICDKISKFYHAGNESNSNILLLSPPSFGKSHAVRILGETYDKFIEHGCSDDIDEISNLSGSIIPDTSGNSKSGFKSIDGALTDAMRNASNGKNVLMFFDEILRWNERTQEFLLTFLNGFKKTVNGNTEKWYRFTTKNANGNSLEVLEAPAKNLHIISGANLTSNIPIEAFWSRFKKIRIDYSKGFAEKTTRAILAGFTWKDSGSDFEKGVERFVQLIDETRQAVVQGSLQFPIDFRILENAIHSSGSEYLSRVIEVICLESWQDVCSWNPDTGCVNEDSQKEYDRIIQGVLGNNA